MPPKKKPTSGFDALIADIVSEGMQRSKIDMDIIEFAKDILGLELWPTQRAILKALYNLPLERGRWRDLYPGRDEDYIREKCWGYDVDPDDWWDEKAILEQWRAEGKTTWVEGRDYSEMVLECGMRGSKTSTTSIIVTYEYFKLLQHDDPASHFGLMPGSLIAMLVLATSEDQAQDTLFAAIKGRVENSPYFQGLINQKKLIVNTLDIYSPDKQLLLWAGHSRSAGLVGRTLMIFAMDEGNRFGVDGQGGASGIDMYSNVGKGTLTLRKHGAKKIVISSAWCEGDITDVLYQKAEDGAEHILAFRLATWDINPQFALLKEEHPEIQAEYQTRGIEAARDYAGIRPGIEENFFNKATIKKAMVSECPLKYEPYEREVAGEDGTVRTYAAVNITVPEGFNIPGALFSYGHCDPGLKRDSFGYASGHPFYDPETGLVKVKIDALVEWRPVDKGRGRIYPVDYENVDSELVRIAPQIKLKRLTFDHWNSAYMIQRLYAAGVSTEEFKSSFSQAVQREIYQVLREWINAERVILPKPEDSPAAAKLFKELTELRLMNGRRIDHPKTGSKDMSDALACVVWKIAQDERRFRYHEVGKQKIRTMGQIHSAGAIDDLFTDEKIMHQRGALRDPHRNSILTSAMNRTTRITQTDW